MKDASTKAEFEAVAKARLEDAEALFRAQRWEGAYYLAGYSIECALKACVAKQTTQFDYPPRDTRTHYSHDIQELLKLAGLKEKLERAGDPVLIKNMATVGRWKETARYRNWGGSNVQKEASDLLNAIADPTNGVFQWLKRHW
jgi:hypothetical protein